LTRNARDFAALAERYSPQFRVIALEFRGRAESEYDPQPTRYHPLTYAGDVIQMLDDLKIPEAIFVGTSLGGLVTMTVAVLAPDRIAAAILNDVGPELKQVGLDRIQRYVGRGLSFQSWEEAAAAVAESQGPSFPKYEQADWLKMARRVCRERDGAIVFDYDMAIAEVFKPTAEASSVDMWSFFHAVAQKPLLVVRGGISELLSSETADKMRQAAPAAKFVEVPDVGHAPMLDEPAAAAAVDKFLSSVAP
jgi:pimeloyl-ACP methyl ester carboxylesterase